MAQIILASHGELAKGMLHSANMIIGEFTKGAQVYCLYPGQNPEDYAQELKSEVQNSDEQYIIVTDILGGSVHTALSQLTIYENFVIYSGMNLSLVLNLFIGDQNDVSEQRLQKIMEESKNGITCINSMIEKEDEDF